MTHCAPGQGREVISFSQRTVRKAAGSVPKSHTRIPPVTPPCVVVLANGESEGSNHRASRRHGSHHPQ
jgi:hypothetical protein